MGKDKKAGRKKRWGRDRGEKKKDAGKERNNEIGGCTLPLYYAIERIIDEELLQL